MIVLILQTAFNFVNSNRYSQLMGFAIHEQTKEKT